jgi:hypothetical protein
MVEIARVEVNECLHYRLRGDKACTDPQMSNRPHCQQQGENQESQRDAHHGF